MQIVERVRSQLGEAVPSGSPGFHMYSYAPIV